MRCCCQHTHTKKVTLNFVDSLTYYDHPNTHKAAGGPLSSAQQKEEQEKKRLIKRKSMNIVF